ncbi:MAG: hypothetical protein A2X12_10535 [Bacteroidetes bacterium GWE2_29_8]|nr:MAG: hypothetical protein A2X12_10535 [Bacteroidetes bacterium GWE2_29_8]OFY23208.1 MAG: hypothetical protein A2X02_09430 [Bacteroidetes bacterium GWF2_29_10]
MSEKYDVVIIGSGLGGLLCGAILSKNGYSVCILEKHSQLGGNLQTFKRKGCKFNTGMHYVGSLDNGQILNKIFKYIGILDRLELVRLDEDCFEKIFIEEKEYCYSMGINNFREKLFAYFPEEKDNILNYINKLQQAWDATNILALKNLPNQHEHIMKIDMLTESVSKVINSITENTELRTLLVATNGLYAGIPDKTPFHIHALINLFFIQSAFKFKNGSDNLVYALKSVIEENNGVIFTNKEVLQINFNNNRVLSLETKDKSIVFGNSFISNIHPAQTNQLIKDEGKLRKVYIQRISNLENSIGSFVLYIILKKKKIKHINSNIYYSKSKDVWTANNYKQSDWPTGYMLYTCPDENNLEFAKSITVISSMKFEDVKKWKDSITGKRDEDYNVFKKDRSNKLIKLVSKKFNNIEDSIETFYSSTPLTYRDYTGVPEGSMYGIIKDCNDPISTFISTYTKIPNLYLTGQNVGLHGILGVTISAIISCSAFIDINKLIKDIREIK